MSMRVVSSIIFLISVVFTFAEVFNPEITEQIYIKLFKRQRVQQLDAIKNLHRIPHYDKQYSMIMLVAERAFTVIQESRATIEASPYIPGVSDFPSDDTIKIALSSILENTALFSEIILRFPDVSVSVLKTNNNWDVLLQWGIAFSNQMRYLLDSSTMKMLSLVSQELNHVERSPNYVNPYRKTSSSQNEEFVFKKTKKRKEIKKGPRLSSHSEL